MDSSLVAMPVYLFVGTVANLFWCWRAVGDVRACDGAASRCALALAVSSLVWVLCCFVQCFMLLLSGHDGSWWDVDTPTGCDIMGTYSIFASVSSQLLVTVVAHVSYAASVVQRPVSPRSVIFLSAACFGASGIAAMLPLVGVGNYTNTGEGFCYYDWANAAHVVVMELVTVPCLAYSVYCFAKLASADQAKELDGLSGSPVTQKRQPPTLLPRRWWYVLASSFVVAWFLWIPAGFIGLGSDRPFPGSFPKGYMIFAGVLGHLQPLINVYLYGVVWRGAFIIRPHQQEADASYTEGVTPKTINIKLSDITVV